MIGYYMWYKCEKLGYSANFAYVLFLKFNSSEKKLTTSIFFLIQTRRGLHYCFPAKAN